VTIAVYALSITSVFLAIAIAGGASIIETILSHGSISEENYDGNS
jgi:hypothetical protein